LSSALVVTVLLCFIVGQAGFTLLLLLALVVCDVAAAVCGVDARWGPCDVAALLYVVVIVICP
jgi:hypothetical protein